MNARCHGGSGDGRPSGGSARVELWNRVHEEIVGSVGTGVEDAALVRGGAQVGGGGLIGGPVLVDNGNLVNDRGLVNDGNLVDGEGLIEDGSRVLSLPGFMNSRSDARAIAQSTRLVGSGGIDLLSWLATSWRA